MTAPRCLSEAALAAIGERIDAKPPRGMGDYAFLADRDRRALRDHAAYLAERLLRVAGRETDEEEGVAYG